MFGTSVPTVGAVCQIEPIEAMPPQKKTKPTGTVEALPEPSAMDGASVERPPSALPGSSNASAIGASGGRKKCYSVEVAPPRSNDDRHGEAVQINAELVQVRETSDRACFEPSAQ